MSTTTMGDTMTSGSGTTTRWKSTVLAKIATVPRVRCGAHTGKLTVLEALCGGRRGRFHSCGKSFSRPGMTFDAGRKWSQRVYKRSELWMKSGCHKVRLARRHTMITAQACQKLCVHALPPTTMHRVNERASGSKRLMQAVESSRDLVQMLPNLPAQGGSRSRAVRPSLLGYLDRILTVHRSLLESSVHELQSHRSQCTHRKQ
mmetsp:Transcript_109954/g.154193  ORF Transcript_109954/g.154193 Transcript_109954/m.154193 type:complete len:203 (-) Transcript_109954:395-1003(-)